MPNIGPTAAYIWSLLVPATNAISATNASEIKNVAGLICFILERRADPAWCGGCSPAVWSVVSLLDIDTIIALAIKAHYTAYQDKYLLNYLLGNRRKITPDF
jgi:hypothetical protein